MAGSRVLHKYEYDMKQAGAEMGQATGKLKVMIEDGIEFGIEDVNLKLELKLQIKREFNLQSGGSVVALAVSSWLKQN